MLKIIKSQKNNITFLIDANRITAIIRIANNLKYLNLAKIKIVLVRKPVTVS